MPGAEDQAMNRATQVLVVIGAFAVVGIVGLGALSRGTFELARAKPVPLVTFPALPDGWGVGSHDELLTLARGPVAGRATAARITVCRNAYAVTATGALAHGLDTDATAFGFGLAQRNDLRNVLKAHKVTLAGLDGYYLDITITDPTHFAGETDAWLARSDLASCVVVLDTSDELSGVDPATQVTVPVIIRLGIFPLPDGGNLMVLIASEGIGTRATPDFADIDEATDIVNSFTFHTEARK
jgi:hypothetical protein